MKTLAVILCVLGVLVALSSLVLCFFSAIKDVRDEHHEEVLTLYRRIFFLGIVVAIIGIVLLVAS